MTLPYVLAVLSTSATDNSAALQSAINAAQTAGVRTVVEGAGAYNFTHGVTIDIAKTINSISHAVKEAEIRLEELTKQKELDLKCKEAEIKLEELKIKRLELEVKNSKKITNTENYENQIQKIKNENTEIYPNFLNECTEPSNTHISNGDLYNYFKIWIKNKYPEDICPNIRAFLNELRKYKIVGKNVWINSKSIPGFKNLKLKELQKPP